MTPTQGLNRDSCWLSVFEPGRIHLILGPTSTGKTQRSVELAKTLSAPVIVMDRLQIYHDLAITTGRPSPRELHGTERKYLDHRLARVDGAEMPAHTALEKLRGLLTHTDGEVILEGGSISLWQAFFAIAGSSTVFGQVILRSIWQWQDFAEHVNRRVLTLLCSRPRSMLDELSSAFADCTARRLMLGLVGMPEALAWCVQHKVAVNRLPELKEDPAACRSLANHIAPAWVQYARAQQASFPPILQHRRHAVEPFDCTTTTGLTASTL